MSNIMIMIMIIIMIIIVYHYDYYHVASQVAARGVLGRARGDWEYIYIYTLYIYIYIYTYAHNVIHNMYVYQALGRYTTTTTQRAGGWIRLFLRFVQTLGLDFRSPK